MLILLNHIGIAKSSQNYYFTIDGLLKDITKEEVETIKKVIQLFTINSKDFLSESKLRAKYIEIVRKLMINVIIIIKSLMEHIKWRDPILTN